MQDQLASLAYNGQWKDVLALLGQQPDLTNATSAGKGYTALHQGNRISEQGQQPSEIGIAPSGSLELAA